MNAILHNGPQLGEGIYTLPDIGQILGIPYHKVHKWIKDYWDTILANDFDHAYSWHDGKSRAVGFHTLIELVVFSQLNEAGIKPRDILKAHKELSNKFNTAFPFATSKVVKNIYTDSFKIYFKEDYESIYSLDGKNQFNLKFIEDFFKNIDFGDDELAARFWPLGRKHSIVVDPQHQCGQPVINGTNISADAINTMHLSGDKIEFIAYLYNLKSKQVKDAIEFCNQAA
jgi:uncharacterized protein (DUF433 family)